MCHSVITVTRDWSSPKSVTWSGYLGSVTVTESLLERLSALSVTLEVYVVGGLSFSSELRAASGSALRFVRYRRRDMDGR